MTNTTRTALAALAFAAAFAQSPAMASTQAQSHAAAKTVHASKPVHVVKAPVHTVRPVIRKTTTVNVYRNRLAIYRAKIKRYHTVKVVTPTVRYVHTHIPHAYRYAPVVATAPVVYKTYTRSVAATVCTGMWAGEIMLPKKPGTWRVDGLGAVEITADGSAVLDCSRAGDASLKVAADSQTPCFGQWSGVLRIDADKPGTVTKLDAGTAQVTDNGRIVLACVARP